MVEGDLTASSNSWVFGWEMFILGGFQNDNRLNRSLYSGFHR